MTLIDLAIGAVAVTTMTSQAAAQSRPAPSWTGYYIGGHVGYRWGAADFTSPSFSGDTPASNDGGSLATYPARNHEFNPDGGFGGAHFGYNWQLNPNWLVGLEGDWSFGRSKATVLTTANGIDNKGDGFTFRHNTDVTLQWQATLRARAGWVVESSLWYVTGGVAFARVKWSDEFIAVDPVAPFEPPSTVTAFSSRHTVRTGWVVGAGYEQMLAQNFTWRVEYLYENFGNFTVPQGLDSSGTLDLAVHKVRVGLTFKQ